MSDLKDEVGQGEAGHGVVRISVARSGMARQAMGGAEGAWFSARVLGPPVTLGNKRAFRTKADRLVVVERSSDVVRNWQHAMREAMAEVRPAAPLVGAFAAKVHLYLVRPKGHYGSGRNQGQLKPTAPPFPTTKPDVEKVARAALDCATGLWWLDDSQVVRLGVDKDYATEDLPAGTYVSAELMAKGPGAP